MGIVQLRSKRIFFSPNNYGMEQLIDNACATLIRFVFSKTLFRVDLHFCILMYLSDALHYCFFGISRLTVRDRENWQR